MAKWQDDNSGEMFDDGEQLLPGEDGFNKDAASVHFADKHFSYTGPSAPAEVTE